MTNIAQACAVAAQPGFTKELQTVQLERGLKVIDSPGVVFDDDDFDDGKGSKKTNILLRNVVKVEDVDDPMVIGTLPCLTIPDRAALTTRAVEEILSRTDLAMIKKLYNIEGFTSPLEFLTMLALTWASMYCC